MSVLLEEPLHKLLTWSLIAGQIPGTIRPTSRFLSTKVLLQRRFLAKHYENFANNLESSIGICPAKLSPHFADCSYTQTAFESYSNASAYLILGQNIT